MSTDFSKPIATDAYATLLPGIQTAISDLVRQMDPALTGTHTNGPTGAKRFNESTSTWERYSGSAWAAMAALYAISISGNAATATNATTAANIAGGAAGSLHVQTSPGTTGFVSAGTNGQILTMVAGAPAWANIQPVAAGVRVPFAEVAAPTGWTQITDDTATDRMLRVTNGSGRGTGGNAAHSPTLMNVVPAHTHGFTTGYQSNDHTHGIGDPGHSHVYNYGPVAGPYNTGGGFSTGPVTINGSTTGVYTGGMSAGHTHSGSTDNGSSSTNWQPRYIDLIICSKN